MNDTNQPWDHQLDVVVVGSGNGGFTAALCSHYMGAGDVLLIEKSDKIGGTSATSGGGVWIPCNHYAQQVGADDSLADAQLYLDQTLAGEDVPPELVASYLENAPKMLRFMHDHTDMRYTSLESYPDYYTSLPGARAGHRSIEPVPIMASELGADHKHMRYSHHMMRLFGKIHFTQVDAHKLMLKLPGANKLLFKLIWDYLIDIPWRLQSSISRRLCTGSAGVARLFLSAKKAAIPVWRNTAMTELISDDHNRVIGVVVEREGKQQRILARKGVVLAAGGFEHNQQMREQYLPKPTNTRWSAAPNCNHGDAIRAGIKLGAATRMMDAAWWCTTLDTPGEEVPRLGIMEKSAPGSVVVNLAGKRIANESQNYLAYQRAQLAAHSDDNPSAPAYQIFDATFRENYLAGPLMTKSTKPDWMIPKSWYQSGFVGKADTIAELAQQLGINADNLQATVEKMNEYAKTGIDEEFQRGQSDYDRYYADPNIKPNPCLAPINKAPFYALRCEAGDFGTAGGLATNVDAQVLHTNGTAIAGLYAIGNCSAPILSTYPGPGATLGPAMAMGYQAAKNITGYTG